MASAGKIDGCMNMKNAVIRKNSHGSRYNDLLGCRHAHTHKIRMGSKREIKKKSLLQAISTSSIFYIKPLAKVIESIKVIKQFTLIYSSEYDEYMMNS